MSSRRCDVAKGPIVVSTNDDRMNFPKERVKIVRPITEKTSLVWMMSQQDALELYHRLGDYLVANRDKL